MNHKDELRQLAEAVGAGLSAYIEVHNEIFREAETFKSLLKNLIGRGVPMATLLEESERLVPMWAAILERLERFRVRSYSLLPPDQRSYFDLLVRYSIAVKKTTSALVDRQRLLADGSRGGHDNPMKWSVFREKEGVYTSAAEEYKLIGEQLNAAAAIVFD